jgi:hypothetical protein
MLASSLGAGGANGGLNPLYHLSWTAVFGFALAAFVWVEERKRESGWNIVAVIGCVLVLLGARELGARLMRKLDWKRSGT